MSGPAVATYTILPYVVFAHMAHSAGQMYSDYQEALERARQRDEHIRNVRKQARASRIEHLAGLRARAEEKEVQLTQLRNLAESWQSHAQQADLTGFSVFGRPQSDDNQAWLDYMGQLDSVTAALRQKLTQIVAATGKEVQEATQAVLAEGITSLDDILNAYSAMRAVQFGLTAEEVQVFRQTADRILKRLDLNDEETGIPVEFEVLARDIVLSPTLARAEVLATELRYRVQKYRKDELRRRNDCLDAGTYLQMLPEDAPSYLFDALTRAAAGSEALLPEVRETAETLIAAATRMEKEQQNEAAAYVLEQSLKDLGYEVESIENTLFTEGGLIHFQKPGWENYFVRMRVDTQSNGMTFNVVRADTGESGAEQKRLDVLAEDRWCSEFPELMKTLHVRGLKIDVTRLLGAGELPIQIVAADSLPQHSKERGRTRRTDQLKLRELS